MDSLKNRVKEISMERTMSCGSQPVYKVIFKNDGTCMYEGRDNVKFIGTYIGKIYGSDFERLVEAMDKLDYINLEDEYSVPSREYANVITTLVYDDKEKRVNNHGDSGPVQIWGIEKIIDAMIEDIYWETEE